MKTIYITRHAKSSWDEPHLSDAERPLLEKGKKRTKKVIDHLLKKGASPELILSSHAVRALETAKIFAHAFRLEPEKVIVHKHIYYSDADGLYNEFYDIDNSIRSVMIVGHNPAITAFSNLFLDKKIDWLPTSGVVCIQLNTQKWEEIAMANRKTTFVMIPKEI